jgi:hypothetical protein
VRIAVPDLVCYLFTRAVEANIVASDFSGNKRTLRAYVTDLLEYPRLLIARDVDFSHCRLGGHHNEFLAECTQCPFGQACRWLDKHQSPAVDKASLSALVEALDSAVRYLESMHHAGGSSDSDTREWIRESRRFLRSLHEHAQLRE